jgi:hypothetical protein
MLPTKYSAIDTTTGRKIPVPDTFLKGVRRATEILESELQEVAERFGAVAKWHFTGRSGSADRVELTLSAGVPGAQVVSSFTAEDFKDDDTIRRGMRPLMSKLAIQLSAYVKRQLDDLQKRIRRDLETLAAISEE